MSAKREHERQKGEADGRGVSRTGMTPLSAEAPPSGRLPGDSNAREGFFAGSRIFGVLGLRGWWCAHARIRFSSRIVLSWHAAKRRLVRVQANDSRFVSVMLFLTRKFDSRVVQKRKG